MSQELKQLVKETWMLIGTEEEQEIIKSLSKIDAELYMEAMNRLEFDESYCKEFGISL